MIERRGRTEALLLRLLLWIFGRSKVMPLVARENGLATVARFGWWRALRRVKLVRLRLCGTDVWVRTSTPDVYVALDSLGSELDDAISLLPPGCDGLMIDAGGYIGTVAIKLAKAFPKARIISVEPSTENLAVLLRNIEGYSNIEALHAALTATPGRVTLTDRGHGEWGFSLIPIGPQGRRMENVTGVSVPEIARNSGCTRIGLLKLDIEGAEADVLAGSRDWLADVDILVAELHPSIVPEIEHIYDRATAGRRNSHLPGEKVMSVAVVDSSDPD